MLRPAEAGRYERVKGVWRPAEEGRCERIEGRFASGLSRTLRTEMAAETVVDKVRVIAERVASGHGLEIFDVQFRREAPGMVLRVRIDRPGPASTAQDSVSVHDCANVSRELSAIFDVEDVVPTAYTLEVSSPGLDRPLRRPDDYRRFMGRRAKVVMRERVDGQGFFRGKLGGVDGADVLIDAEDGKTHRVPLALITRANLEVEF